MNIFRKIFKKNPLKPKYLEEFFTITVTDESVTVEHPERKTEKIDWKAITTIHLFTTDEGPLIPDVWLMLGGDGVGCLLPQGAKGYNEVYDVISKYEGFNFENVVRAMGSTQNESFLLWQKHVSN